jgi:hypothetical protein
MLNSQQTFYNKTTEKAVIAFGNMFNNVYIERYDADNKLQRRIRVPISYAPKDKFLARMEQQPDVDSQREELTLPRLAFEITGIQYDPTRQMNAMQGFKAFNQGTLQSVSNPVPYNLKMALYAVAKTQGDALMMMEQILPVFTPHYTLTMNAMPQLNLKNDLPITLDGVSLEDSFDAPKFEERRQVMVSFEFTIQLNYFGYTDGTKGIIKDVQVDFYSAPDMADSEALEGVEVQVSPLNANQGDPYTVITTIEGFNGND